MINTDMTRKLILFSSSAILLGLVFSLSMVMNVQQDSEKIYAESHSIFSAIEPEEVTKLATTVVKGTIIDQKQVIDYKDKELQDGTILKNHYVIPSQIYTIQTENVIKGDLTPKTFDVKIRGGIAGDLTFDAGFDEYSIGDQLILILEKTDRHEYYRPISEFFGVYQIEENMAIASERTFTETDLLQKLQ